MNVFTHTYMYICIYTHMYVCETTQFIHVTRLDSCVRWDLFLSVKRLIHIWSMTDMESQPCVMGVAFAYWAINPTNNAS